MSDYMDSNVKCPFFKRFIRQKQTISCEGVPTLAASNLMFFDTGSKAKRYLEERCCKDYTICPLARGIMEKYK